MVGVKTARSCLFALGLAAAAGAAASFAGELRAGAAQADITPDLRLHGPVYLAGFGNNRVATGIHDPLSARCLAIEATETIKAIEAGAGSKALIVCGVDSIGLFLDDVERIRALVSKEAPNAVVVIASSHVHQGPDSMGLWGPEGKTGINEAYMTHLAARTAEAALGAYRGLKPAKLRLAAAHPAELDTFIHDSRPPDRHDAEILAVEAVSARDGSAIGTLVNWANHPEALGSKNTLVTADYVARLRTTVEAKRGGLVVFANGAIGGMQSPLGAKLPGDLADGTFEKADYVGRRAGEIAVEAIESRGAVVVDSLDRIEYAERKFGIRLENPGFAQAMALNLYNGRKALQKDGSTGTIAGAFRLVSGAKPVLECALIPGEMYPELSVGGVERYSGADFPDAAIEKPVKQMMTAPFRMLFGLANDEIGYIIPKAEWDNVAPWLNGAPKRWYGEVNSVGPEAAPAIAREVESLFGELNRIYGKKKTRQ